MPIYDAYAFANINIMRLHAQNSEKIAQILLTSGMAAKVNKGAKVSQLVCRPDIKFYETNGTIVTCAHIIVHRSVRMWQALNSQNAVQQGLRLVLGIHSGKLPSSRLRKLRVKCIYFFSYFLRIVPPRHLSVTDMTCAQSVPVNSKKFLEGYHIAIVRKTNIHACT